MLILRALADVEMPAAEPERPSHHRLLVHEGAAGQVEVHLVRAGLVLLGRLELDAKPDLITRQEPQSVVGDLPVQHASQKSASRLGSFASKQSATS